MIILLLLSTSLATDKNCLWHDTFGYSYDISKLHNINNYQVPDTDTSMGMFNMVYEFNFCTGAVRCQGRDVAAFEALEVMGKVTENCDVLGLKETQEFGYVNPVYPELGISVTYKQGSILIDVGDMCFDVKDDGGLQKIIADNEQMQMSPRSVTFEITCGKDEPNFRVIDSSKCNIRLGIQHSAGCRSGSSPSGGSSTFLLYFILVSGIYFGGGIVYNTKKYQLSGLDALPHTHFWRDFPHLVKDGINFTLIRVFGVIKKLRGISGAGGYDTI